MKLVTFQHSGTQSIGVVDGQPDGGGLGRGHRPVRGVLVPGDGLGVAWYLAKKMRSPADEVGAEQVLKIGDDAPVSEQVVDPSVAQVSGVDRVGVAARGQDPRPLMVITSCVRAQ